MTSLSTELKHVVTSSTCYRMLFVNTSLPHTRECYQSSLQVGEDQGLNHIMFDLAIFSFILLIQDERWHRSSDMHHQMWDHSILRQYHQHTAVMYCVQPVKSYCSYTLNYRGPTSLRYATSHQTPWWKRVITLNTLEMHYWSNFSMILSTLLLSWLTLVFVPGKRVINHQDFRSSYTEKCGSLHFYVFARLLARENKSKCYFHCLQLVSAIFPSRFNTSGGESRSILLTPCDVLI